MTSIRTTVVTPPLSSSTAEPLAVVESSLLSHTPLLLAHSTVVNYRIPDEVSIDDLSFKIGPRKGIFSTQVRESVVSALNNAPPSQKPKLDPLGNFSYLTDGLNNKKMQISGTVDNQFNLLSLSAVYADPKSNKADTTPVFSVEFEPDHRCHLPNEC